MFTISQEERKFITNAEDTDKAARRVAADKGDRIFFYCISVMISLTVILSIAAAFSGSTISFYVYAFIFSAGLVAIAVGYFYSSIIFYNSLISMVNSSK